MGITLKQLTDTVSLIKDYVLHKTYKIDQISYAQKTVNTELDYGVFEVTDMTINKTTPLIFSNVNSGNMELSENGYIKLQKDKTYVFHTGLYKADYNRGIALVDSELNVLTDFNTTSVGSYIYEAKEDIEVTFIVSDSSSISVNSLWGCVNVYEINRQIVIDPVEYVNTHQGIEDTPVGHIIPHMGTTSPKHYLICDGTEYGIMDYPHLAQHITDNFGSVNFFGGDGVDTFAVPDLRGEFLRGSGTATRDTGSGARVGEHQDPTKHVSLNKDDSNNLFITGNSNINTMVSYQDKNILGTKIGMTINSQEKAEWSGDGNAYYTSRPTNTSVLYCIKYEPTYFMNINRENTNYLSPTLYSLEERVIGCWIDGKPIYQKTITGYKTPNVTTNGSIAATEINSADLKIDTVISLQGITNTGSSIFNLPMHYSSGQYGLHLYFNITKNTITIQSSSSNFSNKDTIIMIQYTKTTDAENSFTNDMIKDYIVSGGNGSGSSGGPSYGTGPSGPSCSCPTYTDEEVDAAIDEILTDDIIEEEITTVEDTPMVIPEIYEEDEPTVIPETIEDEVPGEVTETPTEEEIIE